MSYIGALWMFQCSLVLLLIVEGIRQHWKNSASDEGCNIATFIRCWVFSMLFWQQTLHAFDKLGRSFSTNHILLSGFLSYQNLKKECFTPSWLQINNFNWIKTTCPFKNIKCISQILFELFLTSSSLHNDFAKSINH